MKRIIVITSAILALLLVVLAQDGGGGSLEITVEPAEALVNVTGPDGYVFVATTPGDQTLSDLAPGSYVVTATAEGYAIAQQQVEVQGGGAAQVSLSLQGLEQGGQQGQNQPQNQQGQQSGQQNQQNDQGQQQAGQQQEDQSGQQGQDQQNQQAQGQDQNQQQGDQQNQQSQGQQVDGSQVYQQQCAQCHGQSGGGGIGPALAGDQNLQDAQFHINQILNGGQSMPAFGDQLSDAEIAAVASYERTSWGNSFGEISADQVSQARGGAQQNQGQNQQNQQEGQQQTQQQGEQQNQAQGQSGQQQNQQGQQSQEGQNQQQEPQQPSSSAPSQAELDRAADSTDSWLMYNKGYNGQRYSSLDQINADNAKDLRPECVFQTGEAGVSFQANPVVYDGVLYITTPHNTYALDATTCEQKWKRTYAPQGPEPFNTNRGVAIAGGRLFRGTTDAHVLALDAKTGDLLWNVQPVDSSRGYFLSSAPIVWNDMVIMGTAGADWGATAKVFAFDVATGKQVWSFDEIKADTFGGAEAASTGGGSNWTSYTLDVDAGLLYVPVGNPAPDFACEYRPGDNLYTNSVIVLNAESGELVRWYQQIPQDCLDRDTAAAPVLFDSQDGHRSLAVASKNGIMYVYDDEAAANAQPSEQGQDQSAQQQDAQDQQTKGQNEQEGQSGQQAQQQNGQQSQEQGQQQSDQSQGQDQQDQKPQDQPQAGQQQEDQQSAQGQGEQQQNQEGQQQSQQQEGQSGQQDQQQDQSGGQQDQQAQGQDQNQQPGQQERHGPQGTGQLQGLPAQQNQPQQSSGDTLRYAVEATSRYNVDVRPTTEGVHVCPGINGGTEWYGPAFDQDKHRLYVPAVDWCSTFTLGEARYTPGQFFFGGSFELDDVSEGQGWITAFDAEDGSLLWSYRSDRPVVAAVTPTAGGVIFTGELTGNFLVLDAESGAALYTFNTGSPIGGGVATYEIGGRQYVAVASGNASRTWSPNAGAAASVFIFALPEGE